MFSVDCREVIGEVLGDIKPKSCTELYLGSRSIRSLSGFEALPNIEVLWLNDNKISDLVGLESNFRLKYLYLQDNKIRTLKGSSLADLKFLEQLNLANNRIRDLAASLAQIAHLKFLKKLDLRKNPIAEETDYRLQVIHTLPSLEIFDLHEVTAEERALAKERYGRKDTRLEKTKLAFGSKLEPWTRVEKQSIAEFSKTTKAMKSELRSLDRKKQREEEEQYRLMFTEEGTQQKMMSTKYDRKLDTAHAKHIAGVGDYVKVFSYTLPPPANEEGYIERAEMMAGDIALDTNK
uniref:Uncharacterized protein n=2 Tax=Palpitomonas bilix TaxID=652834 RepID=A0A7S3FYX4_9EUKA|mmetsp:Transcript_11804/g.31825  ORF Transcript_11804/g.31825 Transcript_11804/m.31825 type:complete len:292 (+) Transcript_11804:1717-2592(+)